MERGSSSGDALPAACQLITQCSLGREDSSASLSKLEQDSLRFGMEGWHKFATNIQSEKAAQKYLMEAAAGDSSRQILEFSNTMQTVSNSLRKVAESNAHLQLEAAEWRRKYEHLLQQRNGEYDSIANLKEGGKLSFKARHDSEEENGYCNSSSSPEGRIGNLSQKASFRLLWGCNGEKPRRHKHDIVSYDCGNISTVTSSNKQITLVWDSTPQAVCIFARPNSIPVQQLCKQMIRWLRTERNMSVFVEPRVKNKLLEDSADFSFVQTWESDEEILFLHKKVDLVITLGGDGTVLWAASMFKGPVPPFISFSMGSLGFMTAFQSERYQECLQYVMKGPVYITLRHRLQCQIIRETGESDEKANSEVYLVLNEVSIDRGMSSSLTNLECYCDNDFVTSVQGDGLILSTTSGSTAYSLAAGGSMVHPHVPAILFTPICPHSLSFRPLILPGYVTIKVQVPIQSGGHAWASFDGKDRVQICAGDALICHVALWPVPTASIEEPTHHFLCSVRERLHWNLRKNQN